MADESGNWLKLYRSFLEWEWYTDGNTMRMFLHFLLNANYKPNNYKGAEVPVGSLVTSYPSLARDTGLTINQCRTAIKHLKSTGEITVKIYSKFSVISIVRWNDFQGDAQSETQSDNSQSTVKSQHYKKERKKEVYIAGKNPQTKYEQRAYDYEEMQRRLVNK